MRRPALVLSLLLSIQGCMPQQTTSPHASGTVASAPSPKPKDRLLADPQPGDLYAAKVGELMFEGVVPARPDRYGLMQVEAVDARTVTLRIAQTTWPDARDALADLHASRGAPIEDGPSLRVSRDQLRELNATRGILAIRRMTTQAPMNGSTTTRR